MSSLFARLRERKIVQWALAYLAGAWIVVQLLDAVSEPLAFSRTIHLTVLILLGVGFLLALVAAWYHGEKGRQSVSGPELLMVVALLIIAGAVLRMVSPEQGEGPTTSAQTAIPGGDRPRVAVLPCDNASPDPEEAIRTSGLHDEVLLKLQKISSLVSIGRTSVLRYAEMHSPTSDVAAELEVAFIGECTVQRSENRIRVIFQLLDSTGRQVWAEDYNRDLSLENILDIQIEIAEQVAQAIGAKLTPQETDQVRSIPTDNLSAYDFYHLGRDRWMRRVGSANREAIAFYESAISEDPEFALAHAALAQAHVTLAVHVFEGVDLHQEYAHAKAAVRRAMELDPDLPEAHAALGLITFGYDWDWDGAERHFLRAIELNPGDAETRAWFSSLLLALGRSDEANAQAKVAVELDPISYNAVRAFLASATEEDGEQVQQALNRILQARPENPYIRMLIGSFLAEQGRVDEALDEFTPLFAEEYGFHEPDSLRALLYLNGVPEGQARAGNIIRYMEEQAPALRTITPLLFLNFGLFEEALAGAESWVRRREYQALQLGADAWEPLYSDNRYLALLDEVGLPRPDIRGLDGG